MGPRFALPVIALPLICANLGTAIRVGTFRPMGKDDVIFRDSPVFEESARSKVRCAQFCARRDDCFHFTWVSGSLCRGHSSCLDENLSTAAPGARTYTLMGTPAWLHKACTVDCQCPAAHSECFKGQCLCTHGCYYSISQNSCTATCEEANLQSTLLEYTGSVIMGYNLYCVFTLTRAQCVDKCLHYSSDVCRTLDFRSTNQECCGHTVTPVAASNRWTATSTTYDFYQRMCA